jgi:hypothetical protein
MGAKARYAIDVEVEHRAADVPILRVGEQLQGKALVTPTADMKVNSVEVQLMWKAHGRGSANEGIVAKATTPDKELRADREVSIPFDFQVPVDAPVSYDGEYVKISWFLRTYLDIPWAIDDEESFPLLVLPRFE